MKKNILSLLFILGAVAISFGQLKTPQVPSTKAPTLAQAKTKFQTYTFIAGRDTLKIQNQGVFRHVIYIPPMADTLRVTFPASLAYNNEFDEVEIDFVGGTTGTQIVQYVTNANVLPLSTSSISVLQNKSAYSFWKLRRGKWVETLRQVEP